MEAGTFLNRDENTVSSVRSSSSAIERRYTRSSTRSASEPRRNDRGRRPLDQRRDLVRCSVGSRQYVEILEAGQRKQEIDRFRDVPSTRRKPRHDHAQPIPSPFVALTQDLVQLTIERGHCAKAAQHGPVGGPESREDVDESVKGSRRIRLLKGAW